MIILALDTCLGACSAAITADAETLAAICEPMIRGHQERLAPMTAEVLAGAGLPWADVERIAVTVGPGSFTGLRIGVAFAKGLALALDRPCVGVGTLHALAASATRPGRRAAIIDAGRGQIYLQIFDNDQPLTAPDNLPGEIAVARLAEFSQDEDLTLIGPGILAVAQAFPRARQCPIAAPTPWAVARLGRRAPLAPPRPLYLRAPDARAKSP